MYFFFFTQTFYAQWEDFITELSTAIKVTISEDDEALMKHILGMLRVSFKPERGKTAHWPVQTTAVLTTLACTNGPNSSKALGQSRKLSVTYVAHN